MFYEGEKGRQFYIWLTHQLFSCGIFLWAVDSCFYMQASPNAFQTPLNCDIPCEVPLNEQDTMGDLLTVKCENGLSKKTCFVAHRIVLPTNSV